MLSLQGATLATAAGRSNEAQDGEQLLKDSEHASGSGVALIKPGSLSASEVCNFTPLFKVKKKKEHWRRLICIN